MIHPASFDEDPDTRFAIYAVYSRTRLKIWEWTARERSRVVLAMLEYEGYERAEAAVNEAIEIAAEKQRWQRMQQTVKSLGAVMAKM